MLPIECIRYAAVNLYAKHIGQVVVDQQDFFLLFYTY